MINAALEKIRVRIDEKIKLDIDMMHKLNDITDKQFFIERIIRNL
jgi:hypothetical protein